MSVSGTQSPWLESLQQQLGEPVSDLITVGGGDFAQAYRATLLSGRQVFVKTHKQSIADFFTTEATGLSWLKETGTVAIPAVLAVGDDPPLLAMEWIDSGQASESTEVNFGQSLAALHGHSHTEFGRPDRRNTGSLGVPNQPCQSWVEFYASQRLLPLLRIASDKRALPEQTLTRLERCASRLGALAADLGALEEPAALLHGDLWAGNRVIGYDGRSWLIDPAAHFGHREFDLAMMRLFGGFSETCFSVYNEVFPLVAGHTQRVSLHQLAPLVVHAIKFAGHYVQATNDALRQYT